MSTWTDNINRLPWHWKGTLVSADNLTTINLTDDDFLENSIKIEEACSDTDKFALGGVITSSFSCTLVDIDQKFGGFDFTNAKLTIEVGLVYEDETEEWHTRGIYYCEKPSIVSDMIDLVAYDAMDKLNKYWDGSSPRGATFSAVVAELCDICGVSYDSTSYWNLPDGTWQGYEFPENTTYRQMISWIVEVSQGFAIVENDELVCKFFDESPLPYDLIVLDGGQMWFGADEASGGTMSPWNSVYPWDGNITTNPMHPIIFQSEISSEDTIFSGVRVYPYNDVGNPVTVESLAYDFPYYLVVRDNPLVTSVNASTVANSLAYRQSMSDPTGFISMSPRGFSATVWCDPLTKCGTFIEIDDINGNLYYSWITQITIQGGGTVELACHAQTYAENQAEYAEDKYSVVQDAVTQANDYTDSAVSTAVSNANSYTDTSVADKPSWFTIYQGSTAQITVASQATTSATTVTFTVPSGYQAIGICGWNSTARACVVAEAHITAINNRNVTIQYALYNAYTSSRTTTLTFDILCVKTT